MDAALKILSVFFVLILIAMGFLGAFVMFAAICEVIGLPWEFAFFILGGFAIISVLIASSIR